VISLLIGASSLVLSWHNSRVQDIDRLQVKCDQEFTAHLGFYWPTSYPVPDSLRKHLIHFC